MRISKEKLDALKKRATGAARRGKAIASNAKPSAIAAVAGALSAEAARLGEEKIDALKDHYWAPGAVVMVAGHFVRRKSQAAGLGMIGAGAALLAKAYRANEAEEEKKTPAKSDAPGFPRRADAGAIPMSRAAALLAARNVYRSPAPARRPAGFAPAPSPIVNRSARAALSL